MSATPNGAQQRWYLGPDPFSPTARRPEDTPLPATPPPEGATPAGATASTAAPTAAPMASSAADRDNFEKDEGFVPSWDGSLSSWRDFRRRVCVWEESTSTKVEKRGAKLLSKLTKEAWAATQTLSLESLRNPEGVATLLAHLEGSLNLSATQQQGECLEGFFFGLRRQPQEAIQGFIHRFRTSLMQLTSHSVELPSEASAYIYLKRVTERVGNAAELKHQLLTLAGGK